MYTRVFEDHVYGVVSNLYAYVAFLLVILTFGMETAFFRFSGKSDRPDRVFSTTLLAVSGACLLFLGLLLYNIGPVSVWMEYAGQKNFIIWMAITVAFDAFTSIPFAKLRFDSRPLRFSSLKLISIALNIGLNLFFLLLCPWIIKVHPEWNWINLVYSEDIGVGYVFISNLLASGITLLLLLPDIFSVKLNFDFSILKQMLKYGLPLLIVGIAAQVNINIDKILLPKLIPSEMNPLGQLGVYAANYKIAVLMAMFIQAFRYSFEPFFFSHHKGEESKKVYADVMKYFFIFGMLIFLGVMFYIDIVQFYIGSDYRSGLKVVPLILLANLFQGVYYSLSLWYKLTDKTRYGAYISIFGAVVTLFINFLLIPVLGYLGSAIAVFVCYFLMMTISYFLGKKHYPVDYDLKLMLFYFVIGMGLFGISEWVKIESMVFRMAFNTLLLLLFFAVLAYRERNLIKRLLGK